MVAGVRNVIPGAGNVDNAAAWWAKQLYPVPGPQQSQLYRRYVAVQNAANKWHIPDVILWGVYGAETSHGADVTTSSAGARGSFQFIEGTAREYHYPYSNATDDRTFAAQADAAAHYLHDLTGGKPPKPGSATWTHVWDSAIKRYSGGGYGLSKVIQEGRGAHTVGANQAASEGERAKVEEAKPAKSESLLETLMHAVVLLVLLAAGAALVYQGVMLSIRPRSE